LSARPPLPACFAPAHPHAAKVLSEAFHCIIICDGGPCHAAISVSKDLHFRCQNNFA